MHKEINSKPDKGSGRAREKKKRRMILDKFASDLHLLVNGFKKKKIKFSISAHWMVRSILRDDGKTNWADIFCWASWPRTQFFFFFFASFFISLCIHFICSIMPRRKKNACPYRLISVVWLPIFTNQLLPLEFHSVFSVGHWVFHKSACLAVGAKNRAYSLRDQSVRLHASLVTETSMRILTQVEDAFFLFAAVVVVVSTDTCHSLCVSTG